MQGFLSGCTSGTSAAANQCLANQGWGTKGGGSFYGGSDLYFWAFDADPAVLAGGWLTSDYCVAGGGTDTSVAHIPRQFMPCGVVNYSGVFSHVDCNCNAGVLLKGSQASGYISPSPESVALPLTIQSGNNQQRGLNSAGGLGESFDPLSVLAATWSGTPVAGVAVTFACVAPSGVNCALANASGPQTVTTNASGVATLADHTGTIGIYSQGGTGALAVTASGPGFTSATFQLW